VENLGKRTTLIFTLVLLLSAVGWNVALTKVANAYPHLHCNFYSSTVTCAAAR
jgi:hypothetical protein